MTRVLVTGAAGFMGSHLFEYLKNQEYEVVGVDNYSIGKFEHPDIYKVDLRHKHEVDKLVATFKPEIVYHLAAWAHEGLSQFCPIKITENNYNAHINLITACIKNKVKRYVVASSMSVYGDQTPPFNEEMPKKPCDIYAISKAAIEDSTQVLCKVHGMEYVIVRPHNVYGPRQVLHDPYRNVVAIFINRLLANKNFYIYGDGEQKRSFSYIDDVTPYIAKCGWENINGEIINIGPLEEFTINQLSEETLSHFPDAPKPEYVEDRPAEVKHAWCTNDKAQKLLGYTTSTSFKDGIKQMVEWARSVGHQKPKYLKNLELVNENTPITWKNKLI